MSHDPFKALREFTLASGKTGKYYALAALEQAGLGKVSRLPVSLRIVLESLLRNCDGKRATAHQVNLEYLARGVWEKDGVFFPDTLVGSDSHTPMVNGIGVLGWGVGGWMRKPSPTSASPGAMRRWWTRSRATAKRRACSASRARARSITRR